jgi:maleate isomerase
VHDFSAGGATYVEAARRRKIGHITPSANTVLEPLTTLMSASVPEVSHHFTRIRVEAITLEPRHTSQFNLDVMLGAACLLADAAVDAIMWNGTSGAWNGVGADIEMCARITEETGIPASTTTLAQFDAMRRWNMHRYGLAVPYAEDVTARMVEVYATAGIEAACVANAGESGAREMAFVSEETVIDLLRRADASDAECLMLVCTGVAGAQLVQRMEAELGKPIIDSVAVTLWKGLELVGLEPAIPNWGKLLAGHLAGSTG